VKPILLHISGSWPIRVRLVHSWAALFQPRGLALRGKGKKQKLFLVLSPSPGPDGPNASGWYRRLRKPISPLSLLNCDQPWQLFSHGWTILLSTIIYDLDSRILPNIHIVTLAPLSPQCRSFQFSLPEMLWNTCISEYLHKIRTWRFHRTEEDSNNFSVSWHITHISMAISTNLGRDTNHNSTKLVCSHPLFQPWVSETNKQRNSGLKGDILNIFFVVSAQVQPCSCCCCLLINSTQPPGNSRMDARFWSAAAATVFQKWGLPQMPSE